MLLSQTNISPMTSEAVQPQIITLPPPRVIADSMQYSWYCSLISSRRSCRVFQISSSKIKKIHLKISPFFITKTEYDKMAIIFFYKKYWVAYLNDRSVVPHNTSTIIFSKMLLSTSLLKAIYHFVFWKRGLPLGFAFFKFSIYQFYCCRLST